MASARLSDKTATTERKPIGTTRAPAPPKPQIHPPLLSDGMEALRDANC